MNILFLSRWFPIPSNNGSKLRVAGLLRGLASHHSVTLLSFTDQPNPDIDLLELNSICSEVHVVSWREFDPHSRRALLGFFSLTPRFLIDTHSEEMADMICNLISNNKYDLVIASELSMAAYHPYFNGLPALFEELELGQFQEKTIKSANFLKNIRLSLTWYKLRMYLARLLDSFQSCTVVSEHERNVLIKNFPAHEGKINIIPNCIQFADYQRVKIDPLPKQLVYSGSFRFYANYEAMQWFLKEVYPTILEMIPDVSLIITGDHADLPLPTSSGVSLTGYVEDVKPIIASSAISLAPLLSGGGTRLKILEAMALGTPVVATSKGAEGLDAVSGEQLIIADTPKDFADQVVRLLNNPNLHAYISQKGRDFVKEKYNWERIWPQFLQIVDRTVR